MPPMSHVSETARRVQITRLKLHLLALGKPNYEVAAAAGIAPSQLSRYSSGRDDIRANHLVALCELLDVEPEELMGWTEVMVG